MADSVSEKRRKTDIELSFVVPCLDEETNICRTLKDLDDLRRRHGLTGLETIVLDDASSDRTFQLAQGCVDLYPGLGLRVFRRPEPRRGYGAILRFGVANARGDYCAPIAADGVDPIDVLPEMMEKVRSGADLVQCSRYQRPGDAGTIPFKYKFYQSIWRRLVRIMLGAELKDSTYSFKVFRRVDVLSRGMVSNGFSVSPEIFFKSLLSGATIGYVAAGQGVRNKGSSKFVFHREGFGYFYVLLRAGLHRIGILWF